MKSALQKKATNNLTILTKGFTLVELLVVISIIAIVSVVAVTQYNNLNADARDAKRKSELEAIATTLEVNKTAGGGAYTTLQPDMFGGRVFPGSITSEAQDPQGFPYCISFDSSTTIPPVLPSDLSGVSGWDNTVGTTSCPTSPAGWNKITGMEPANGTFAWTVCTRVENKGNPEALCRTNTQ
jgi:prepilin-type N-terminal cleavage/methylation domain-containing protein